jgi:hypothetical protein
MTVASHYWHMEKLPLQAILLDELPIFHRY